MITTEKDDDRKYLGYFDLPYGIWQIADGTEITFNRRFPEPGPTSESNLSTSPSIDPVCASPSGGVPTTGALYDWARRTGTGPKKSCWRL